MCCSTPHQSPGRFSAGMFPAICGCGCVGKEQSAWHLEHYKEHLKTELAMVEKRIQAIRDKQT
jgi:hypothetical protein